MIRRPPRPPRTATRCPYTTLVRSARERAANIRNIQKEHRQILAAIRTGDADKAETLATSHSLLARKRATDFLSLSLAGEVALKEPGQLRTAGKKKQHSFS